MFISHISLQAGGNPGVVVKAACLESRISRVHSKETLYVSSLLTRKDTLLWGAYVTER